MARLVGILFTLMALGCGSSDDGGGLPIDSGVYRVVEWSETDAQSGEVVELVAEGNELSFDLGLDGTVGVLRIRKFAGGALAYSRQDGVWDPDVVPAAVEWISVGFPPQVPPLPPIEFTCALEPLLFLPHLALESYGDQLVAVGGFGCRPVESRLVLERDADS